MVMIQDPSPVPPPACCADCSLRSLPLIAPAQKQDLQAINQTRQSVRYYEPQMRFLREGELNREAFTLFDGWAFRYKGSRDGRRRILNFLLPGDLIGFQPSHGMRMDYTVQTLTKASTCVFNLEALRARVHEQPHLASDIAAIVALSEPPPDILAEGRSSMQRLAHLLLELFLRLEQRKMTDGTEMPFPLTQRHLAESLGLDRSRISRLLKRLSDSGYLALAPGVLVLQDRDALCRFCDFDERGLCARPLF